MTAERQAATVMQKLGAPRFAVERRLGPFFYSHIEFGKVETWQVGIVAFKWIVSLVGVCRLDK